MSLPVSGFFKPSCPLSAAQEAIIVLQVILTYAGRTKNKYIPIYTHLVEKTDPESLQKQKQQLGAEISELGTEKMGFDSDPIWSAYVVRQLCACESCTRNYQ